jgi:L-aspartate oxidase
VEEPIRTDVAVVGAGAAGLYAALVAAREGARVALVSRSPLAQTASFWAQGGIAAALAEDDSPELHADDTIRAARELARASAVRVLCEASPASVHDLQELGVQFDADRSGNLALGLEGGHSRRRIVHAGGSATGRRITRDLSAIAATDELITVLEPLVATALLTHEGRCVGLVARSRDGEARPLLARAVILATGGMAALWARTTNPGGAIGAGLTLAEAAGARLADLEFMQFHPTALRRDGPRDGFLITEAVRGEGAKLLSPAGERFVDELAPRDQVALSIQSQLDATGAPSVDLDMRALDLGRFPNIAAALAEVGIDPARELVPVAPAAHYTMGGVAADLDGRSSLPGLYAVGECACTGLHGANRLASNSLAECFVFGRRAGLAATADPEPPPSAAPAEPQAPNLPPDETRAALWSHAGLLRDPERLRELLDDPYPLARLIAASCLTREESRGAHQRVDRPERDPALDLMHTLVGAGREPAFEHWE